ncbi:dephospho-CoA kinase [bacterium]|nr:dephospho-CoA kinase [bacterium]
MGIGNLNIKKDIILVGITGIFGSGKTSVASIFKKENIPVISCDEIVHQLLEMPQIIEEVKEILGPDVAKGNKLDRKKMAQIIFSDKEKKTLLENLIHPLVFKEIEKRILDTGIDKGIIVIEIPLLFETKSESYFDKIIVVSASPKVIKERLKGKFSEEEIEKRWENQLPLSYKEKKADFVINNSSTFNQTYEETKKVIEILKKQHCKNKGGKWKKQKS